MRLLVVGGIHGNEPLGIELVESLERHPIGGVETVLANPEACRLRRRYVEADMNRVFPGNADEDAYEVRRVRELWGQLSAGYDLIVDFHNTHTPNNDCSFVGDRDNRRLATEAARFLGLSRTVIARYDCINRYLPNCVSVEISLESPECRVDLWRTRLQALALARPRDLASLTLPLLYRFKKRITREEAEAVSLSRAWAAFEPIPREDATALGLEAGSRAIFIEDDYTPWNFAAVVEQVGASLATDAAAARPAVGAT